MRSSPQRETSVNSPTLEGMDPERPQTSEAPAPDKAPAPGAPEAPAAVDPASVDVFSLIPSGVERLPPPDGASRSIPGHLGPSPSFVFLAVVSVVTLASDIGSKLWAERHLDALPGPLDVWAGHLDFILAKNRGGAWGLLQSTNENVRRPFFLLVSAAAIAFIVTLYRRLLPTQRALKWGLPLVLGGALGNVFDRIRYGHVIDFIDIHVLYQGVDHHWPTFNVADIAICVGVGLMAIDMFTSRRPKHRVVLPPPAGPTPPAGHGEPPAAAMGSELPAEPIETKPAS